MGADKFIFADNNIINTEKLEDVLQDYINNGLVDIIEIFGSPIGQGELFTNIYDKYKKKCEWLSFFDFDEYLVMHFEKGKYIKLKEFLSNPLFNNCDVIEINWLFYGDNDLVYYDNRTLVERFTTPKYTYKLNRFVKSIARGNLTQATFSRKDSPHQLNQNLRICNSIGKRPKYYMDSVYPPIYKYAYLKHFRTKTAEEYIDKIKRGNNGNIQEDVESKVNEFFGNNKFSLEKLKVFEKGFNRTFEKYHNKTI